MIGADATFALLGCLLLLVWVGYTAERTKWGAALSAPLIILLLSFAIGNLGVLPSSAPIYGVVQGILVPLAIPLLLFSADLRVVFLESRRMVVAFSLVTVFTIIGGLIGAYSVGMGAFEAELVGVLSASYIGGSANFIATAKAVGFADSSLYSAALTADALGAMFFLTLLMALPAVKWIAKRFPPTSAGVSESAGQASTETEQAATTTSKTPSEGGVVFALLLSAAVCALGLVIAAWLPIEGMFIIAITLLSLLIANLAPQRVRDSIQFDYPLGTIFMYVFFATIGLGTNLSSMVGAAIPIVLFLVVLVIVHILLLVIVGSRLRFTLAEMMIASSACILGPAAAAALAASKGWRHLVTPGMLVGVLGYAIATFIGITLTNLLR